MKSQEGRSEISLQQICDALAGKTLIQPQCKLEHALWLSIQRHQAMLDWILQRFCQGHIKPRTRRVLYWALTEILWMDGVAAPCVVHTAVEFSKQHHAGGDASFLNAVLRNILREMESKGVQGLMADAPDYIACDLPRELWQRWQQNFGNERTQQLCHDILEKVPVTLRRRRWPRPENPIPPVLLSIPSPEWASWAELYEPTAELEDLSSLMATGDFYIQDMATLLAPTLLAPMPGESIGDFCCAPGGKSRVILELLEGQGKLLASDKSKEKLPRVQENLRHFDNVTYQTADASEHDFGANAFDAILLDVPCSNTGVIRRKPDVKWSFSLDKLKQLNELQRKIMDNAANSLKEGGRMVYSTCSIEPDENQQIVDDFLNKHQQFKLKQQQLILPTTEHDGAFAALLTKS